MRQQTYPIWVFLLFLLLSCGGEVTTDTSGVTEDTTSERGLPDVDTASRSIDNALPASYDCTIPGQVMEGNQFWIREREVLIAIVADSTTYDEDFGDSHRILEVYNTQTCDRIAREELPVNVSPDYPYYLAEITYNNTSRLVGIRGANTVYIYDIGRQTLLPVLQPQFLSDRLSEDAQSGNILRLEVWENYLIGYAQDEGTFAFRITPGQAPTAVLPIAEFKTDENEYIPLFAFANPEGSIQLAMPAYNLDADRFSVNTLFTTPQQINTTVAANVRNNRYIVLRRQDRGAVAIDMRLRQLVDLPAEIATQKTQDILKWIRDNRQG